MLVETFLFPMYRIFNVFCCHLHHFMLGILMQFPCNPEICFCQVAAYVFCISVLLPTENDPASSFKCLAINKRDGNCSSFSGGDQVDFSNRATCLDPLYNVLWR